MIPQLRDRTLRALARALIRSGTFRRHLGAIDQNLDPHFLRAAALLRDASDEDALFARDLVNNVAPDTVLWVLRETGHKRAGYFVEFGAGDGVTCSNTCLLEKTYGWHGIVAEPNPLWHEVLRRNRTAVVDPRCVYTATSERVEFAVTEAPLLSTIAAFAGCDGHAQARQAHRLLDIDTVSLNDLLQAHEAPRNIDFISIDTEGSELEILRRFDFRQWNVLLFSVEHNLTDREAALDALMQQNGYRRRYAGYPVIDAWYRKAA